MIKDLRLSKLKSKSVQIDNLFVEQKYVDDFITDIEIESNYFRFCVSGNITCNEELFTLSIGKTPETLKDTKITLYLEDDHGSLYVKSFFVTNAVRLSQSPSKNMWLITFIDVYGRYLASSEYTSKITKHGYSGKPLEIIKDVVTDLIDEYDDCKIEFKRNDIYFIKDNTCVVSHRFVKDKTPIDNIKSFCEIYNIHMFQDNNSLKFVQNPTMQDTKVLTASDGTSLYTEVCSNNYYECKICDKIRQSTAISNLDRVNYKISFNDGGKKQNYKYLNFSDFLPVVLLNSNVRDYRDFINADLTYYPSTSKTLSCLVYENYVKYLRANTLVVYTRSTFDMVNVGSVVSVDIRSDKSFAAERSGGDHKFSGNWLVTSSTIKIVDGMCFFRLRLNRFDNQKDPDTSVNAISNGEVSEKPESTEDAKLKREQILAKRRSNGK